MSASIRGWSCGFSDRPREIDHLVCTAIPPSAASTIQHPPSNVHAPLPTPNHPPVASAVHPPRCIIVRPHELAPTSSTCPGQAVVVVCVSLCAYARAIPRFHTHLHLYTYTSDTGITRRYIHIYVYIDGWSRGTSRHELRGDGGASVCDVIKPASGAPSLRFPPPTTAGGQHGRR